MLRANSKAPQNVEIDEMSPLFEQENSEESGVVRPRKKSFEHQRTANLDLKTSENSTSSFSYTSSVNSDSTEKHEKSEKEAVTSILKVPKKSMITRQKTMVKNSSKLVKLASLQ